MNKCGLTTIMVMLFITGCGSTENDEVEINLEEGETAISIGGQIIKAEEVVSEPVELNQKFFNPVKQFKPAVRQMGPAQFREKAREQVKRLLITKITDMLIHKKAVEKYEGKNVDERLEQVTDEKVRELILEKKSPDKAEQYLKDRGLDWESYRSIIRANSLNRWYLLSELPETPGVRYDEIVERYEQIKDERFGLEETIKGKVLKITIPEGPVQNVTGTQLRKAYLQADKVLQYLHDGAAFGKIARNHPGISVIEYEKPVRTSSLKAELAKAAHRLKPGEISNPIQSSDRHYIYIMKLDSKEAKSYQPLSEVEQMLRREIAMERRSKPVSRLIAKFEKQAKLGLTESFVDACVEKIYELSTAR